MEKTISFGELCNLKEYDDSNSVVWTALIMRDQDLTPMNDWFHTIGFIESDKNLVDWKKISGNVRGNDGRSDILLIFDNKESSFNPLVRLQIGREVKWTSDFVDNFKEDYYE